MVAAAMRCVSNATASQGSVSQVMHTNLISRRMHKNQRLAEQSPLQADSARRMTRLSAAAVETRGTYSRVLENDPTLSEMDSRLPDPKGGKDLAVALAQLAWETKAESVRVLHVAKQSSICSYMVLATVFSRPQLTAVLGKIERSAALDWGRKFTPTGGRSSWEMLDLGDVIVNVMSEDARLYYDLEGLYGNGTPVDLPFMRERPAIRMGDEQGPGGVEQWTINLKQP